MNTPSPKSKTELMSYIMRFSDLAHNVQKPLKNSARGGELINGTEEDFVPIESA